MTENNAEAEPLPTHNETMFCETNLESISNAIESDEDVSTSDLDIVMASGLSEFVILSVETKATETQLSSMSKHSKLVLMSNIVKVTSHTCDPDVRERLDGVANKVLDGLGDC